MVTLAICAFYKRFLRHKEKWHERACLSFSVIQRNS